MSVVRFRPWPPPTSESHCKIKFITHFLGDLNTIVRMKTRTRISPVILSGGEGSRLWPLSRKSHPKQFLNLAGGDDTIFQLTVKRLEGLQSREFELLHPVIVTNEEYKFLAVDQLKDVSELDWNILLEPVARNTAPALCMAALNASREGDDPVLVVCPSDHAVRDEGGFLDAIESAIIRASHGGAVLLGVKPDRPETGYGYIKLGAEQTSNFFFDVESFVEKPIVDVAQKYINLGGYVWNAGIFVLRASTWIKCIEYLRSDIANYSKLAWDARKTVDKTTSLLFEEYSRIPRESIDFAVMERFKEADLDLKVIPLDAGWSDLGSWQSVGNYLPKDNLSNVVHGDVLLIDCEDSYSYSSGRLVVGKDLKDTVIIETQDAVLVCKKSQSENVRDIVESLDNLSRLERNESRIVRRPWGGFEVIESGAGFKVKRITVNVGQSISLQKHMRRAEHWIVVKGKATVQLEEKFFDLTEGESTFIPAGKKHRLLNRSDQPLGVIEVQTGGYLEEDDIIRFEDQYGRISEH